MSVAGSQKIKMSKDNKSPFDIWDHFKGNYTEPKDMTVSSDALLNWPWFTETNNQDEYDAILDEEIDLETEDTGIWCNVLTTCKHEPVDVGFAVPKLVCKKCNKDL